MDFSFPKDIADNMINHMNEDHVDAMSDYCRHIGVEVSDNLLPKMVHIDKQGFDLQLGQETIHFDFEKPCNTPQEVREALVDLAKLSRDDSP